ncbi:hypothetical protein RhiTH_010277 [Rhizoctonia solani]
MLPPAIAIALTAELLSAAHLARTEEKGPETEEGECSSLLQDNCIAVLESKFTHNTKITSQPGLYPKLAQALELVETINHRQKETQRGLVRAGWTNSAISAMLSNTDFNSVWSEWVCRPGIPTNKDWTDTIQKLTSLLKEDVVVCSKQDCKRAREKALSKGLNILLVEISPPVLFAIVHPRLSMWDYKSPSLYQPPFPSFAHICNWAVIKDLWESNLTEQEILVQLGEQREAIKVSMVKWKRGIESHLANLAHGKRKSRALNYIVQPTMLRFESLANTFDAYTDAHKMLLQGDVLFYDTRKDCSPPIPITYSNILRENGLIASPLSLKPHPMLFTPVSLNKYDFYLEAHLVHHYIASNKFFKGHLEGLVLLGEKITYRNVHNTSLWTEQPMFGYCLTNPPREPGGQMTKRRKCLLCAQIPGLKDVIAPEWAIFRHLQDV